MNILSGGEVKPRADRFKHVLPFYRISDLDSVPEEITLDQFEALKSHFRVWYDSSRRPLFVFFSPQLLW